MNKICCWMCICFIIIGCRTMAQGAKRVSLRPQRQDTDSILMLDEESYSISPLKNKSVNEIKNKFHDKSRSTLKKANKKRHIKNVMLESKSKSLIHPESDMNEHASKNILNLDADDSESAFKNIHLKDLLKIKKNKAINSQASDFDEKQSKQTGEIFLTKPYYYFTESYEDLTLKNGLQHEANNNFSLIHRSKQKPSIALKSVNYPQKESASISNNFDNSESESYKWNEDDTEYKNFMQKKSTQRNSSATSEHLKHVEDVLENELQGENNEEDTKIYFGVRCDQLVNETCWFDREVGDVLTLSVAIDSERKTSAFQVRWIRVYHEFQSKKGRFLEMLPSKLPWNMVLGAGDRELRLNPVTNTDIDPNSIVAKVFTVNKHRGKSMFTFLKSLHFRLDIPIIDMGKVYAGEELSINVENFITLPENGNMIFDWSLEISPHHLQPLPSNIKVSNSGRSVVLKELRKGHLGILNCVIYSSNNMAVAKRRFNILKIDENVMRRSIIKNEAKKYADEIRKCRDVLKRKDRNTFDRIKEITKPKSRRKRFRRENHVFNINDCDMKKWRYSRLIRSLFGDPDSTTLDPRVMSLEKLIELSEEGDGTLDNLIPREIHYVEPSLRYKSGTFKERSSSSLSSLNCTKDEDCIEYAVCIMSEDQHQRQVSTGYCYCKPEFYSKGDSCIKIPIFTHRYKRQKRFLHHSAKSLKVPENLFYVNKKNYANKEENPVLEYPTTSSKVLAFEEEESFLLSDCMDNKDCNDHAICIQPTIGHPYCKCGPGFRGNGIFCWEIMDYVPPEEQFVPEEETVPQNALLWKENEATAADYSSDNAQEQDDES